MIKLLWKIAALPLRLFNAARMFYYSVNGIKIGKYTYVSPKAYLDTHKPGKIVIGENCYITGNVIILTHSDTRRGGPLGIWEKEGGKRIHGDVIIGNNVFVGAASLVMPGVKIGDNVIVGAMSLVNKDIPEGKIAVGIPAKVVGNTMDHVRNG